MRKLLKVALVLNKKNKQISLTLPKKQLDPLDRKRMGEFKKARIFLEGFE